MARKNSGIRVKVEGVQYVKASHAYYFTLAATKGEGGAKTTFFQIDKENLIKALQDRECYSALFGRNEENTLCWKGLLFVTVARALNDAKVRFVKIPCDIAKKEMKLDRNGSRATTEELFIAEYFHGKHIGGLKNSGGIKAGESGKLADVKMQGGKQIEVKGWYGRMAGMVSWENVMQMYRDGIFNDDDLRAIMESNHAVKKGEE